MQTPPKIAAYALSLFVFGLHSAFVVVCFLALLSFRLLCTCCGFVNGVNVIRIVIVYFSRPGSIASWVTHGISFGSWRLELLTNADPNSDI